MMSLLKVFNKLNKVSLTYTGMMSCALIFLGSCTEIAGLDFIHSDSSAVDRSQCLDSVGVDKKKAFEADDAAKRLLAYAELNAKPIVLETIARFGGERPWQPFTLDGAQYIQSDSFDPRIISPHQFAVVGDTLRRVHEIPSGGPAVFRSCLGCVGNPPAPFQVAYKIPEGLTYNDNVLEVTYPVVIGVTTNLACIEAPY